jgi:hypothetical protein
MALIVLRIILSSKIPNGTLTLDVTENGDATKGGGRMVVHKA